MRETFSSNLRKVRESQRKCSGSSFEDVFVPTWFLYKYLLYLVKTCAQAESKSNLDCPQNKQDLTQTFETIEVAITENSVQPVQPSIYFDESLQVN